MFGVNQSRAALTRVLSVSREPWAWRGEWGEATGRTGIAKRITQTRACFTVSLRHGFRSKCVMADDRMVRRNRGVGSLSHFFAMLLKPREVLLNEAHEAKIDEH